MKGILKENLIIGTIRESKIQISFMKERTNQESHLLDKFWLFDSLVREYNIRRTFDIERLNITVLE